MRPQTKIVSELSLPKVEEDQLRNGIKIYYINSTNNDLTQIKFVFGSGAWEQERLIVANTTAQMLLKGTDKHSADEIADFLDFYGVKFTASSRMHSTIFTLYSLNKHLEKVLDLVKEILEHPVFDEKELEILTKEKKQQLIIDLEDVDYVARNLLSEQIYGKNYPYGWHAEPADYDAITPEYLKKYFNENFCADNLKIIIVSKQKSKTLAYLNEFFSNYKDNCSPSKVRRYSIEPMGKYRYIEKKESLQAAIYAGWEGVPRSHPDYYDLLVMNSLFGGYYGSRLMQNIRQRLGLTYGIYSRLSFMKNAGHIEIGAQVRKEAKERVIDEIKKEVENLINKHVDGAELDKNRRYLAGALLRGIDGEFNYADAVATFITYNLGFDTYEKIFQRINSIKPVEIQQIAQKYLDLDKIFLTVVG